VHNKTINFDIQLMVLMKQVSLFFFLLFVVKTTSAQHVQYTDKDYAKSPVWKSMIKDTLANYFETEKAFNLYFQHHENPAGENDEIGEHQAHEKHPSKREQRKIQEEFRMRMDVKKYEHWHDSMKPYVQADGRILTPSERIAIWEAQRSKK